MLEHQLVDPGRVQNNGGSVSPRWQHLSRMIASCVLHYLKKLFIKQNKSFFIPDKWRHLMLCL